MVVTHFSTLAISGNSCCKPLRASVIDNSVIQNLKIMMKFSRILLFFVFNFYRFFRKCLKIPGWKIKHLLIFFEGVGSRCYFFQNFDKKFLLLIEKWRIIWLMIIKFSTRCENLSSIIWNRLRNFMPKKYQNCNQNFVSCFRNPE